MVVEDEIMEEWGVMRCLCGSEEMPSVLFQPVCPWLICFQREQTGKDDEGFSSCCKSLALTELIMAAKMLSITVCRAIWSHLVFRGIFLLGIITDSSFKTVWPYWGEKPPGGEERWRMLRGGRNSRTSRWSSRATLNGFEGWETAFEKELEAKSSSSRSVLSPVLFFLNRIRTCWEQTSAWSIAAH